MYFNSATSLSFALAVALDTVVKERAKIAVAVRAIVLMLLMIVFIILIFKWLKVVRLIKNFVRLAKEGGRTIEGEKHLLFCGLKQTC
jgi:hypothetical protein